MILHLRVVPGFWIAVEELRRPELRSRPVVIGGLPHQRGSVCEANIPAQRHGVRAGMTLSQAHQHCPDGVFLVPDLARYEAVWRAVCEVLRAHTPLVEPLEMGQAACDLSGVPISGSRTGRQVSGLRGMAETIALQIREAIGIVPWLGVASNCLVAQLASTTVGVDGITVVEVGQEQAAIADLPIELLPDVDERLVLTFRVLGLRTIGQLAALPAASVRQRFGTLGEKLHRSARGIDPRPVVPPPLKPSVVARRECEDGDLDEALAALHRLAEACAAELQERCLAGRLIELTLEWEAPSPPPPLPRVGEGKLANRGGGRALPFSCVRERGSEGEGALPIAYRIHSMLPQPNYRPAALLGTPSFPLPGDVILDRRMHDFLISPPHPLNPPLPQCGRGGLAAGKPSSPSPEFRERGPGGEGYTLAVRTPIYSSPPLLEQAQRLLLQHWPGEGPRRRLQAIELKVSEFEPPAQLSFAEFNRLGEIGALRGMDPERLRSLAQQEQVLAARYGENLFRHLAAVDPDNVLAERRFRWQPGLPCNSSPPLQGKGGRG